SSGQRLQGFQNGGTTPADLRVDRSVSAPTATSEMSLNVNLDATESVPLTAFDPNDSSSYNHKISTTVYDSLGETHQMDLYFRNTAVSGSVEMSAYVDGNQVLAPNTMTFNSAGRLSSSASVSIPGFNVGNGSEDMNITLNTSEISRYASDFSVNSIQQDGYSSGSATAISVGKDGRVSALYSNGETRDVGQVALADFPNPQGLSRLGNNGFAQSHESGSATVGYAGSGSLGQVQAGTLETSNVNLEEQLIQLKMAQREVQANVQVLKAEGEMIGSLFRDKA
ncbi:MAG: flagellar hook-basal body complex protein, partial [Gammaproteobacteria bacterium]|nr:flagellar hook-basal body complex protein [Gammaproteobacteria bacterium]